MPRKSVVENDILIQAILDKKQNIYDHVSKKIWGPSHQCWKDIESDLGFLVSHKYIYTVVKGNRFNILDKLEIVNVNSNNEVEVKLNVTSIFSSDSNSDNCEDAQIKFIITLSDDEWTKLYKGERRLYNQNDRKKGSTRTYDVLSPNDWSIVINEHFFLFTQKHHVQ